MCVVQFAQDRKVLDYLHLCVVCKVFSEQEGMGLYRIVCFVCVRCLCVGQEYMELFVPI